MAKVMPKLEILVDLTNPVAEIKESIMAIVNSHPGRQFELLQELDLWLCETIASVEQQIEASKEVTPTEQT